MSDPQTFKPTKRSIEVFNRLFKDGIPDHLKDHTIIVRTMRSEEDDT